ncbi:DoxX family protein [Rhodococcus sp. NPDC058514]|uniref:DoxX family protein n=1 Tax=unclassified Rhodococcus (in: high G+C Gram-positive bacteria) TaxID=192944 RepID=UPI003668F439
MMFAAYAVVAVVLALALAGSAYLAFTRDERLVGTLAKLGVPDSWLTRLALAKFAGAVGLVVGLAIPTIGIAAALGVVLYFVGAVVMHLRARDFAIVPPVVLCLAGVAALVLRVASM